MAFFPMGGNPFAAAMGGGFQIPSVSLRFTVNAFFDRKAVKDALTAAEYQGLTRSSMRVKDYARRSIRKIGNAKPKLKVAWYPSAMTMRSMRNISNADGLPMSTRTRVFQRYWEIKTKPPSMPGTPPHTHVPHSNMLGFRRNLYNFYDSTSRSAVVGPSKKGRMIPFLHEFGGTQQLRQWVYVPRYDGFYPIVWGMPPDQKPRNASRWRVTDEVRSVRYPERPYMYPAMLRAIARGDLARAFGGTFRAGQAGRGVILRG